MEKLAGSGFFPAKEKSSFFNQVAVQHFVQMPAEFVFLKMAAYAYDTVFVGQVVNKRDFFLHYLMPFLSFHHLLNDLSFIRGRSRRFPQLYLTNMRMAVFFSFALGLSIIQRFSIMVRQPN